MVDARDFATSRSLLEAVFDIANEDAWRTFVQRYRPLILAWCRRHGLQDADAEDAAATVLLKLAQAMPKGKYDPNLRFRSWLKTVIDHAVNDLLRHDRRRPARRGSGDSAVQEQLDQVAAPGSSAELAEQLDQSGFVETSGSCHMWPRMLLISRGVFARAQLTEATQVVARQCVGFLRPLDLTTTGSSSASQLSSPVLSFWCASLGVYVLLFLPSLSAL